MKIVDAQHHFWDPIHNPHPWLNQQSQISFRYGDYTSICRPFLTEDYTRLSKGFNIIASITMEEEWDTNDPTGEARWMSQLAEEFGSPSAHVAQAWLNRDGFEEILEIYSKIPLVRSVRHKPRGNRSPVGNSSEMMDLNFREGFAKLANN